MQVTILRNAVMLGIIRLGTASDVQSPAAQVWTDRLLRPEGLPVGFSAALMIQSSLGGEEAMADPLRACGGH